MPKPNARDTTYYGIVAAHSKNRKKVVRARQIDPEERRTHPGLEERDGETVQLREEDTFEKEADESYIPWAKLLRKVFGVDAPSNRRGPQRRSRLGKQPLSECGGRMSVKKYVSDEEKAREELKRLGIWQEAPRPVKARRPVDAHGVHPPFCDGVDPPAPDEVA